MTTKIIIMMTMDNTIVIGSVMAIISRHLNPKIFAVVT